MSAAIIVLQAALTGVYVIVIGWLALGVRRVMRSVGTSKAHPLVSVIVAARNEETAIGLCLSSVLESDYPNFEVLVVDDGSTDKTKEVVSSIAMKSESRVRLVSQITHAGGSGKVAAIIHGVATSRGDVIVTLDADCIVSPGWLSAMLSFMTEDVGFVAGPVTYESSRSVLRRIEALEFMSLIGVGAGAIGRDRPLICNSANAAYRRHLFEEMMTKGTPRHLASADELLMNYVDQCTPYGVAFCSSHDALVRTNGADSFSHFIQQRMRWVGIVPHLPRAHKVGLGAAYMFFLMIAVCLVGGLASPGLAAAGAVALLAKGLTDALLLWSVCRPFGLQRLLIVLPAAEVLYLPYVLLTAPAGLLRPAEWKGRMPVHASRSSIQAPMEA